MNEAGHIGLVGLLTGQPGEVPQNALADNEERRRGGSDCLRDMPVACHGPKGS